MLDAALAPGFCSEEEAAADAPSPGLRREEESVADVVVERLRMQSPVSADPGLRQEEIAADAFTAGLRDEEDSVADVERQRLREDSPAAADPFAPGIEVPEEETAANVQNDSCHSRTMKRPASCLEPERVTCPDCGREADARGRLHEPGSKACEKSAARTLRGGACARDCLEYSRWQRPAHRRGHVEVESVADLVRQPPLRSRRYDLGFWGQVGGRRKRGRPAQAEKAALRTANKEAEDGDVLEQTRLDNQRDL